MTTAAVTMNTSAGCQPYTLKAKLQEIGRVRPGRKSSTATSRSSTMTQQQPWIEENGSNLEKHCCHATSYPSLGEFTDAKPDRGREKPTEWDWKIVGANKRTREMQGSRKIWSQIIYRVWFWNEIYTGLPDYQRFVALDNVLKPRSGFSLNNYKIFQNLKYPKYFVCRSRARKLCEIDNLFLTLARLHVGLLERPGCCSARGIRNICCLG